MFYNLKTKEFYYQSSVSLPTTIEVEGEEVESEDTYLLDILDDEALREIGFARVVEENPAEVAFMQRKERNAYNEERNLYLSGFILEPKSLEDCKKEALGILNQAYEEQINQVLGDIPLSEILTWSEQEKEAKAYLQSQNEADAPTLKILSTQRGIPLQALCEKALQKAEAYRVFSSQAIGKRQAAEDRITRAENLEQIQEVLGGFEAQ